MSDESIFDDGYTGEGEDLSKDKKRIFAKFKSGENIFRLVPPLKSRPIDGKVTAFAHAHKHFYEHPDNLGKNAYVAYICPKWASGGHRKCDDCQDSYELRQTDDEADEKLAKSLSAKHVVFTNVVDRDGDPDECLVLELSAPINEKYAKGFSKFEKLKRVMDNKRSPMNVMHPVNGHDVIFEKTGSGQLGTSYTCEADPRESKLHEDDDKMMALIQNQHDLRNFIKAPSDEDIAKIKERARTWGHTARKSRPSRDEGRDADDGGESGIQKQVDEIAGADDDDELAF